VYKVETEYNTLDLIHKRLNHLSKDYLIKTLEYSLGFKLNKSDSIKELNKKELTNCEPCIYGKSHEIISYKPLGSPIDPLIYFDVDIAGPFKHLGLRGERYFITFTCRKTRLVWLYCLKTRSEAINKFILLINLIKNQFNINIKGFHLDNAKEFKSTLLLEFCSKRGVILDYTSPYAHSQNSIAERLNRYLIERLITILIEKNIPIFLWPYILIGIVHVKNRTYNSAINTIPYYALTKEKPNIAHLRVLGSLVYTFISKETRAKDLGPRARKGILVGFESSNSYLAYIPSLNKVISARDIIIKEDLIYKDDFTIEENYDSFIEYNQDEIIKSIQEDTSNKESEKDNSSPIDLTPKSKLQVIIPPLNFDPNTIDNRSIDTTSPRRSSRLEAKEPIKYSSLASEAYIASLIEGEKINKQDLEMDLNPNNTSNIEDNKEASSSKIIISKPINPIKEPKDYRSVLQDYSYKDQWINSMFKEILSLVKNNTWTIVNKDSIDPNIKPLKARWVYKIKDLNKDQIEFKSRLVAKGFEQKYGLDYLESFASVIKQMAWKLLFALAVLNRWLIYKIDMISAFIQGDIDYRLYLLPPEGLIELLYKLGLIPNLNQEILLLLNKALYGLKQSARIWFNTLTRILINKLGFKPLGIEPCILVNKEEGLIICLYVDDLALISPNINSINSFIKNIKKYFNIKELGPIQDYLGIDINYNLDKQVLKLSQERYIDKLVERFNLKDSLSIYTPLDSKVKLELNKDSSYKASKEDIKYFQSLIGSLLYITLGTRPDIAYSTIKLSRYSSNPSKEHIDFALRIVRYLKTTKDITITYKGFPNTINGYCDSDYAGDIETSKSTLGYVFYLASGPISWKSKLQSIIAQSTTEAEFIAINAASKEAVYLKSLLEELGFYNQKLFPLYTDNNGALLLSKNPRFHERTKHIAVKYYYIRDLIEKGIIDLLFISTKEQKADGLTKALDRIKFNLFLGHLGLNSREE